MSVIQKIRDKGAWIMFGLIAIALISFILQDRALGGGRGGIFTNTTTLGKINGVSIERADFETKLSMMEKMYGQQAGNREQLIPNVWNQEVERIINEQEYNKLGLIVSDKELSDILFDPQQSPLKREFTDEKTGIFDITKAKQIMAQMKKSKNAEQIEMINEAYLKPTIQQKLHSKYNDLLQQSVYIPKWLAPPFTPNTGPSDGSRSARTAFFPSRRMPIARPIDVVVFPSPAGVGLMAVTSTSLPFPRGGWSGWFRARSSIFALPRPYGSMSSSWRPSSRATS